MVTGELTYKGKIYYLDPQEGLVSVKDIPIRHTQAYEDGAFAFFKAKGATRALEILNKADYASYTQRKFKRRYGSKKYACINSRDEKV